MSIAVPVPRYVVTSPSYSPIREASDLAEYDPEDSAIALPVKRRLFQPENQELNKLNHAVSELKGSASYRQQMIGDSVPVPVPVPVPIPSLSVSAERENYLRYMSDLQQRLQAQWMYAVYMKQLQFARGPRA